LVGDRDDFGWHPPDLMARTAAFQVYKRLILTTGKGVASHFGQDFIAF
jgi:hypothetical protein